MTPQKRPCGTRRLSPKQQQRDRDSHWLAQLSWSVDCQMTPERRKQEVEEIVNELGGDPWPEKSRRTT